VRDLLQELQPQATIFYYAGASRGEVSPGSCGGVYSGSDELMTTYWTTSGYNWLDGYVVEGDATNWAAGAGIPAISVTLRSHSRLPDDEWQRNLRAILAVLAQAGE
jgi:hypothetical protein